MPESKTVLEYPTGLSSIPYASFLQIEKYSYDEAQKKVQSSQNDALSSLANSRIADIVDGGVDVVAGAYGSELSKETRNQRKIEKALADDSFGMAGTGFLGLGREKISLADADDSTEVIVNGRKTTIGALKKEKARLAELNAKGLMSSMCNLPLPNEFQYKYGADWNNEFKLGTLALAADDAVRFAAITGTAAAAGGFVQSKVNALTDPKGNKNNKQKNKKIEGIEKIINTSLGAGKKAADPFKVNSELNPKNIAGLAGLAPNENSIQFFQRMQGRQFGFRFELAARNKVESDRIVEVIEWFKRGMHPNSKNGRGSAVMLTFPDVFFLTPKFVRCNENGEIEGKPIQHPMMPKTKLCALTSLTINTTPFGQLQTIFDGTIPVITMELSFTETTKLTRVDMEGSTYTKNRGVGKVLNKGQFRADPKSVGTSEVTY
tara:strand:+ start:474 stop:1775 length:1302 start_codon:yes stop_codon:yes gene_type:complete